MNQILPRLRGLNAWTLKQKIKDNTIQRTATIRLLQKIDVIHWNNPATAKIDTQTLCMYQYFTPLTNPNLRFKGNLTQRKTDYINRFGRLRTTGEMKSHSFVIQFLQCLESQVAKALTAGVDAVTIKDTSNSDNSVTSSTWGGASAPYAYGGLESPSGNTSYGILVGTGTTAPANANYVVETLVAHGSGAGQLNYQPTTVGAAAIVGSNVDLVITRVLINSSGNTVTLKEIALVDGSGVAGSYKYYLWARDTVNQAVAATEVAVVSYCLRTTV